MRASNHDGAHRGRLTLCFLLLVTLVASGCQPTEETLSEGPATDSRSAAIPRIAPLLGPQPGSLEPINLPSGRSFLVQLPAALDDTAEETRAAGKSRREWPVVFVFHGWKETAAELQHYTQMSDAEAIVVFPQGVDNAWAPAPYASTTGEEDIDFVHDIVDSLRATYPVDRQRIYAAGMSNGGGFAQYLACQEPGLVAGVAAVAAANYDPVFSGCAASDIPRLSIHGTHDEVMDYFGGDRHDQRYQSVPDVVAMDAQRNGCTSAVRVEKLEKFAIQETYQGCRAPLQHVRITGGGHIWPGRPNRRQQDIASGFATDKVLDFFAIPGRETS